MLASIRQLTKWSVYITSQYHQCHLTVLLLLVHLFNKYFLSTCLVPGTVSVTEDHEQDRWIFHHRRLQSILKSRH